MPDGSFIDADNYGAASAQYKAAHAPKAAAPVAPKAAAPVAVNGTVTPEDNFAGRSKTQYGVGERLRLDFTTNPLGATAASFGGLQWYIKNGKGTLVNEGGNNGKAIYTCPENAEQGSITLELRTTGMPAAIKATRSFTIVAPNNVVISRAPGTGTFHRQGIASSGFRGEIFLQPAGVSFRNLEIREGSAPSTGTGSMAQNINGFKDIGSIRHATMGTWVTIGGGSIATGCKADGIDEINAMPMDPPFAVGTFTWSIPWYYRIVGSHGTDRQFAFMHHQESVDAAGQMTMTKGGTTVVHNAADPDSDF